MNIKKNYQYLNLVGSQVKSIEREEELKRTVRAEQLKKEIEFLEKENYE